MVDSAWKSIDPKQVILSFLDTKMYWYFAEIGIALHAESI